MILFLLTALGGALLYPQYRIDVRTTLEDLQLRPANGVFEIKEHLVALGLGTLPAYWLFWRTPLAADQATSRRYLTWLLAFIVWWGFRHRTRVEQHQRTAAVSYPSLKIFSLLFGVVYATVFYMEWALFRYYPETNSFYLAQHREDGPAILWYGWLVAAAIVSAAVAFLVPRRMAERLPNEARLGSSDRARRHHVHLREAVVFLRAPIGCAPRAAAATDDSEPNA